MGGFNYFVTTNHDSTTTTLDSTAVGNLYSDMWDAGANAGTGYLLMVSTRGKKHLSAEDTSKVQLTRMDSGRGEVVEYLNTDFGRVSVGVNRYLRAADAFLFSRDQVTDVTVRPWMVKPLSTGGDYDRVAIIAEKSLKFKRERHAGKFSALTA
jgi:hypothetical protein